MVEHKFNPNEHIIQIKSRNGNNDYLPVNWRLVWANDQCQEIQIETVDKIIDLDRETEEETYGWNSETRRNEKVVKHAPGWAYFEMRVTTKDQDGNVKSAVGSKSEKAASFGDFIEKAQTGAIGRALAMIGYGTQFTGDEFDEAHRIVDAPVDRSQANGNNQQNGTAANAQTRGNRQQSTAAASSQTTRDESDATGPITEQQQSSIAKLRQHLGKEAPTEQPANYQAAKELIAQLSQEYRTARAAAKK